MLLYGNQSDSMVPILDHCVDFFGSHGEMHHSLRWKAYALLRLTQRDPFFWSTCAYYFTLNNFYIHGECWDVLELERFASFHVGSAVPKLPVETPAEPTADEKKSKKVCTYVRTYVLVLVQSIDVQSIVHNFAGLGFANVLVRQ